MAEPREGEDREYVQLTHRGVRAQAHVEEADRGRGNRKHLVIQPLSQGGVAEWIDLDTPEGREWSAVHDEAAGHLIRGEKRQEPAEDPAVENHENVWS